MPTEYKKRKTSVLYQPRRVTLTRNKRIHVLGMSLTHLNISISYKNRIKALLSNNKALAHALAHAQHEITVKDKEIFNLRSKQSLSNVPKQMKSKLQGICQHMDGMVKLLDDALSVCNSQDRSSSSRPVGLDDETRYSTANNEIACHQPLQHFSSTENVAQMCTREERWLNNMTVIEEQSITENSENLPPILFADDNSTKHKKKILSRSKSRSLSEDILSIPNTYSEHMACGMEDCGSSENPEVDHIPRKTCRSKSDVLQTNRLLPAVSNAPSENENEKANPESSGLTNSVRQFCSPDNQKESLDCDIAIQLDPDMLSQAVRGFSPVAVQEHDFSTPCDIGEPLSQKPSFDVGFSTESMTDPVRGTFKTICHGNVASEVNMTSTLLMDMELTGVINQSALANVQSDVTHVKDLPLSKALPCKDDKSKKFKDKKMDPRVEKLMAMELAHTKSQPAIATFRSDGPQLVPSKNLSSEGEKMDPKTRKFKAKKMDHKVKKQLTIELPPTESQQAMATVQPDEPLLENVPASKNLSSEDEKMGPKVKKFNAKKMDLRAKKQIATELVHTDSHLAVASIMSGGTELGDVPASKNEKTSSRVKKLMAAEMAHTGSQSDEPGLEDMPTSKDLANDDKKMDAKVKKLKQKVLELTQSFLEQSSEEDNDPEYKPMKGKKGKTFTCKAKKVTAPSRKAENPSFKIFSASPKPRKRKAPKAAAKASKRKPKTNEVSVKRNVEEHPSAVYDFSFGDSLARSMVEPYKPMRMSPLRKTETDSSDGPSRKHSIIPEDDIRKVVENDKCQEKPRLEEKRKPLLQRALEIEENNLGKYVTISPTRRSERKSSRLSANGPVHPNELRDSSNAAKLSRQSCTNACRRSNVKTSQRDGRLTDPIYKRISGKNSTSEKENLATPRQSTEQNVECRRTRRQKTPISYKEPTLNKKMRKE